MLSPAFVKAHVLRATVTALFGLVCACGTEGQTPDAPGGSAGAGGGNAGAGAGTGGTAGGGAPAAGSGGSAGGSGASAAGTGGSVGGGGASGASTGGAAGSAGTSGGGIGGAAGGGGTAQTSGNGGGAGSGGMSGNAGGGGTLVLTSPAFANVDGCSLENPSPCAVFPDENVSYEDNANISPELHWTGVPAGTQSFAIVLFDVTFGQAHWAIWNIPGDVTMLAADVPQDTAMPATPAGSQQANANFAPGGDGYFGPHLPCNVFRFEIYALSLATFSPMDPTSAVLVSIELQELREPELVGFATLTGRSDDYMTTCD
jgi:Raf kinase inhibitor-like YbhB/YbcL family protein